VIAYHYVSVNRDSKVECIYILLIKTTKLGSLHTFFTVYMHEAEHVQEHEDSFKINKSTRLEYLREFRI